MRKIITSGKKDVAPSTLNKNPTHTSSGEGTDGRYYYSIYLGCGSHIAVKL